MATVEALKDRKDIELMKAVLKERNLRHYILFVIGCNTGLRIGDILRLRVSDFINGGKVVKYLQVKEEKTGKERRIAINASIQKALKLFVGKYGKDDFLFTSRKGDNKPITTTQAYRILNDAANHCRLDINFGTHTMRKTWAYHTYKATGNNIGLIMDMLNHSSPSITLRYIGITQEQKDSTYMMVEI